MTTREKVKLLWPTYQEKGASALARFIGVSRKRVSEIIREEGLKYKENRVGEAIRLRRDGYGYREIADILSYASAGSAQSSVTYGLKVREKSLLKKYVSSDMYTPLSVFEREEDLCLM